MERIAGVHAALHHPSARVCVFQRVVQAVGIAVEVLRVVGALHKGIHREERRHHGVVATAVHVNQAEGCQVLMACVASVEHRLFEDGVEPVAKPCVGVAKVAPSVETQFLLNIALRVGYRRPRTKMILQGVVHGVSSFNMASSTFTNGYSQFLYFFMPNLL